MCALVCFVLGGGGGETSAKEANKSYLCASKHLSKHLLTGNDKKSIEGVCTLILEDKASNIVKRQGGRVHRRAVPQISLQFQASPKQNERPWLCRLISGMTACDGPQ